MKKGFDLYRHPSALKFWNNVLVLGLDQCWPWLLETRNSRGYGVWYFQGKEQKAHRIAYLLTHGELTPGQLVLHKCDVRDCCNPTHLREGTHQDNMDDIKLHKLWKSLY